MLILSRHPSWKIELPETADVCKYSECLPCTFNKQRPDCGSILISWHLRSFSFPCHLHRSIFCFLSPTKNKNKQNLAPRKTTSFTVHLPLSFFVCPSVLLPTHERRAWPPVPSRHELIYQNTWTNPLVLSTGFVKCSSPSQFLGHSQREIPVRHIQSN